MFAVQNSSINSNLLDDVSKIDLSSLNPISFVKKIVYRIYTKPLIDKAKLSVSVLRLCFELLSKDTEPIAEEDKQLCNELLNAIKELIQKGRVFDDINFNDELDKQIKTVLYFASAIEYLLEMRLNEKAFYNLSGITYGLINQKDFDLYEMGKGVYESNKALDEK